MWGLAVGGAGGLAHDGDRAGGVVEASLGGRAQEEVAEAAAASCADDEEVGVGGHGDEGVGAVVEDDLAADGAGGGEADGRFEDGEESVVGVLQVVAGVEPRSEDHLVPVESAPAEDRGQRQVSDVRFSLGPARCGGGAGRLVDADDDAVPARSVAIVEAAGRGRSAGTGDV